MKEINVVVQKVIDLLPVFYQLLDKNSYVTVMDVEGTVLGYALPEGEKPRKGIGEYMEDPSGAFDEVVKTGVRKYNYLPKEVMGEAFEGYVAPIKDSGHVVGVIIYTHSAEGKDNIRQMATEFKGSIEKIDESILSIMDGITYMVSGLKEMEKEAINATEDVKNASDVVGKISGNASRSTILALNASIEAARSGEAGRGFSVVAKEMGKLANDSGISSKDISDKLKFITKDIEDITKGIEDSNDMSRDYLDKIAVIREELKRSIELAEGLEKSIEE